MRTVMVVGVAVVALAGCDTTRGLFRERSELVLDPQVCVNTTLPVYFAESQAGLTREASDLIRTTAERMRGCSISRVRVLGLADASGSVERNRTLSERRAINVGNALAEAGWPTPAFELMAAGEAGAVQGGVAEPVRRRVEVVVEASAPSA